MIAALSVREQMREALKDVTAWLSVIVLSIAIVGAALFVITFSGQAYVAWASVPRDSIYPFGFGILIGVFATFMMLARKRWIV